MNNTACTIPLTQGKTATVSREDYEFLSKFKWCALKDKTSHGYRWRAVRCEWPSKKTIYMHRVVAARAGLAESRYYDHKDRDGLNNTRQNLRPCTGTQNNGNQAKRLIASSRFKGVCWDKVNHKWESRIKFMGKKTFLGRFDKEEDAAAAYADAAMRMFGEFACLS